MGGAIGFTLREENGKEHRMCRWTNAMSWMVDHIGIPLKDPMHVQSVVAGWYEMVDDYNHNRKKKSPMAWCYVPDAGLHPTEYGLVVVDLQKNVLLDMNDYHWMGHMAGVCLANELEATHIDGSCTVLGGDGKRLGAKAFTTSDDVENDAKRFLDFYQAGRAKYALDGYRGRMERVELDQSLSLKELARFILAKKRRYYNYVLDMSPLKVQTFEKDKAGFEALYQAVKDLGFKLSKDEEKAWKEYGKRFEDEV